MKSELVSRTFFAGKAGVSPPAITNAFKRTHPACVGKKIDINHPDAQAYISQRPFRDEKKAAKNAGFPPADNSKSNEVPINSNFYAPDIPDEIPKPAIPEELAQLTLEEIVQRYGGLQGFKMYVTTLKELEAYQAQRDKRDLKRTILIDKKYEGKILFEGLELLFDRLIKDMPVELTQRVISIVKRGEDDMDLIVQNEYIEANSRALKICRDELLERLKMDESELKNEK